MEYAEAQPVIIKQSMLAWFLLVLVVVLSLGAVLVQKQTLDATAARLVAASRSEEKAKAALGESEGARRALEVRVQELQSENGRLSVKVAATRLAPVEKEQPTKHSRAAKRKHRKHH